MKDFIPKGTGNSRWMKSSIPTGTTWEEALAMLRAGTFPFDLNGVNSAGVAQMGDALNKANLLTDATASLFGLGSSAVPNTVLAKIPGLISEKSRVLTGSYAGTGTYGASNPSKLTAPGVIRFAMFVAWGNTGGVWNNFNDLSRMRFMITDDMLTTSYAPYAGFSDFSGSSYSFGKKSTDGTQFLWYNKSGASDQFNASGYTYYYVIIYE